VNNLVWETRIFDDWHTQNKMVHKVISSKFDDDYDTDDAYFELAKNWMQNCHCIS